MEAATRTLAPTPEVRIESPNDAQRAANIIIEAWRHRVSHNLEASSCRLAAFIELGGSGLLVYENGKLVTEPLAYFARAMNLSKAYVSRLFTWGRCWREIARQTPDLPSPALQVSKDFAVANWQQADSSGFEKVSPPLSEYSARILGKLLDRPKEFAAAWKGAQAYAEHAKAERVTAAHVKKAVANYVVSKEKELDWPGIKARLAGILRDARRIGGQVRVEELLDRTIKLVEAIP